MTPEQDEALTRVGPGTPMGELFRRYWLPVAASVELTAGAAMPVRVLGEDLALFRTTAGDARARRRALPAPRHVTRGRIRRRHGAAVPVPRMGASTRDGAMRRGHRRSPNRRTHDVARRDHGLPASRELGGLVFAYLGPDACAGAPPLRPLRRGRRAARHRPGVDPVQLAPDHGEQRRPRPPRVAPRPPPRRRCASRPVQPAPTRYARRHVEIGFDEFRARHRQAARARRRKPRRRRLGASDTRSCSRNMVRVGCTPSAPIPDPRPGRRHAHACTGGTRATSRAPGAAPVEQHDIPVYDVPFRDDGGYIVDFVDGGDIMTWVTQGADRRPHARAARRTPIAASCCTGACSSSRSSASRTGADPIGVSRRRGRRA